MPLTLVATSIQPVADSGALLWENSDRILLEDGTGVLLMN